MAGLLDTIDDPQSLGLLSLGLRLMSTPGKFGQALGTAGQGALGDVMASREAAQKRAQMDLQAKIAAVQLQQAQAAQQKQAQLDALAKQYARTPEQMAMQANGGPTNAAAAALPTTKPGFDFAGYAQGLAGIDPMQSLSVQQALQKDDTPVKLAPGEQLFSGKATGYKPLAKAGPKEDDFVANMRASGIDPQSPQGQSLMRQWLQKQSTHTPPVSVTVTTEKDYAGKIAGGLAERDLAAIDAAANAPDAIASSQRIRSILAKQAPITGTGADARLAIGKALYTAGLTRGDDVVATENLQRELSQATLKAIKSSGLGGGSGFSNADRDFLEKAAAGTIATNAQTLARVADLNEQAARKQIDLGNVARARMRSAPGVSTIPFGPDIQQPGGVIDFGSMK